MKGVALHCGRYGCVIKLADGRLGNLAAAEAGHALVRRSLAAQRRPEFDFIVSGDERWPRLHLAQSDAPEPVVPTKAAARDQSSLDEKIIDYLRQTADWDPTGALASRAIEQKSSRAERMTMASEVRARRRTSPAKRSNSKKH
jgi:hypothetical protein